MKIRKDLWMWSFLECCPHLCGHVWCGRIFAACSIHDWSLRLRWLRIWSHKHPRMQCHSHLDIQAGWSVCHPMDHCATTHGMPDNADSAPVSLVCNALDSLCFRALDGTLNPLDGILRLNYRPIKARDH